MSHVRETWVSLTAPERTVLASFPLLLVAAVLLVVAFSVGSGLAVFVAAAAVVFYGVRFSRAAAVVRVVNASGRP